jgi:hypothetical protein
MNANIGAKLLLKYDVIPDTIDAYFRFFVGRYIPVMQAMGLEVSEAWQTAYGNEPNRLIGFVSSNEDKVLGLLNDNTWLDLNDELEKFVTNFSYKIIRYQEGFQF